MRLDCDISVVWVSVTPTGMPALVFVTSGVKINRRQYNRDILEADLLLWAKKHSQDSLWNLKQSSIPSHSSKMIQHWIQQKHSVIHKQNKEEGKDMVEEYDEKVGNDKRKE